MGVKEAVATAIACQLELLLPYLDILVRLFSLHGLAQYFCREGNAKLEHWIQSTTAFRCMTSVDKLACTEVAQGRAGLNNLETCT